MRNKVSQIQWMLIRMNKNYQANMREVSAFELKSCKIFEENLVAFTSNPKKLYWDVPTIVGASVFELAKFHMYRFHYKRLTTNFDCQLLFSDTNSLLNESKSKDLSHETSEKKEIF